MERPTAQQLVSQITDYVNTFSLKPEEFISAMSREHRTLQQSFTRLCMEWLEHCASDGYRFDDRNKATSWVARDMVNKFIVDHGFKPSQSLPTI